MDPNNLYDYLFSPFIDYGFMRRAWVACFALGIGAGPVGVFLTLRRMTLVGDAMSHAVMPGAAIGYLVAGSLSLFAMGVGGLIAGLLVTILSGFVTRTTILREDASFASFYLFSLAIGVLIVSFRGSNVDLMHVLFGTILAIDSAAIYLVGGIASFTILVIAFIYRPLITESFDPVYLRSVRGRGHIYHFIFMTTVVMNLVAGFEALGTLMAVGMIILPAVTALLWAKTLFPMMLISLLDAFISGYIGLLASYHTGLASGPTIIVVLSFVYFLSLALHKVQDLNLRTIFRKIETKNVERVFQERI